MKYELNDKYLSIDIDSLFYENIQEFMDAYVPSKKMQHLLIQNKWINLDGNPVKRESDIVGLKLNILLYPEQHDYVEIENNKLQVVYEDEIMLVVNKPKGVLVHDDGASENITLADYVQGYLADRPYIDAQPLHRLDKETTGLVVFSKSPVFQPLLDKYLSDKMIRRSYLAFVQGEIREGETFVVNKPIGKDRHNNNKRVIAKNGLPALTKFRSLGYKKGISILRCVLDTGRTHQIRVHLSSMHYPILNDEIYGVASNKLIRMGLFADMLELYHPLLEENMELEAEMPKDMAKLYQEIM